MNADPRYGIPYTGEDYVYVQVLPYAGTQGHAGSSTSQERAEREAADGTATQRQRMVLSHLETHGSHGLIWKELAEDFGWHHGQASSVLSVLHKTGRIARLSSRRERCSVYVLPHYVGDRRTEPHGGKVKAGISREAIAEIIHGTGWAEANTTERRVALSKADSVIEHLRLGA